MFSFGKEERNNNAKRLETALKKAAINPIYLPVFYEEFMKSELFIMISNPKIFDKIENISNIVSLPSSNIPVFTSKQNSMKEKKISHLTISDK